MNFERRFKTQIVPIILCCFAAILLYATFFTKIPKEEDLEIVSGKLKHFYHKQVGRFASNYVTIIEIYNDRKIWTRAINKEEAANLLTSQRIDIKAFIIEQSNAKPIEGADKAYGLWINNSEIVSASGAINSDRIFLRYIFPMLTVFIVAVAYCIRLYNLKKLV